METRSVVLVLCRNYEEYAQAVDSIVKVDPGPSEKCVIPIIAEDAGDLSGFPEGIATVRYDDIDTAHIHAQPVAWVSPVFSSGCCLSVGDDVCHTAAHLLSAQSSRYAERVEETAEWEEALCRTFDTNIGNATLPSGSVTLIVPGWTADQSACDSQWLRRTLVKMRSMSLVVDDRPWGIITAPSPVVLTRLVAKALVHHAVADWYAEAPSILLTSDSSSESKGWMSHCDQGESSGPLQIFDKSSMDDNSVLTIVDCPASLLVVNSHGRSYCAVDGMFCGARDLSEPALAEVESCVLGMDCAAATFPQIDPRRYDTPILVLDNCGGANWASMVWEAGVPSIAYFALAGSVSALLVGDGLTVAPPYDNSFDLVWALLTEPTLGEAAARLNAVRPDAAVPYPYFILGDPDIVSGPRWRHWIHETEVTVESENPASCYTAVFDEASDALFARIRLPMPEERLGGDTIYITADVPAESVPLISQYRRAGHCELWFNNTFVKPTTLRFTQAPSIRLPQSLVESAERVREVASTWRPSLAKRAPELFAACDQVVSLSHELDRFAERTTLVDMDSIEAAVEQVLKSWKAAQLACCKTVEEQALGGIWQADLWCSENYEAHLVEKPCDSCGLTPTIERVYDSPPGPARIWSECYRCDITADRPLVSGYPTITLDAPASIAPDDNATVKVRIACESGSRSARWCGAGLVVVAGTGHGVIPEPQTFEIDVASNKKVEQHIDLRLPVPPIAAHLYRLRVLTILNNHWFWASRFLMVRRQTSGQDT